MKTILRIIIFPITLILSILIAFSKFIVTIGSTMLDLLSFLVILGSLACFMQNKKEDGVMSMYLFEEPPILANKTLAREISLN